MKYCGKLRRLDSARDLDMTMRAAPSLLLPSLLLASVVAARASAPTPTLHNYSYHGCLPGGNGAALPWCDFTKSHAERIKVPPSPQAPPALDI